ncbi:MAG TPA: NEW3 domain-containing protein [Ilumatobacteraceae bacterium]|nr:NEW3 domain-containing protein [Ilumatobacteraceae bacterium]
MPSPRRRRPARRIGAALAIVVLIVATRGASASADPALTISTPYPSVAAQPGSTVEFDVSVSAGIIEPVDLEIAEVPDGWSTTMRGGGFVVQSVTAAPDTPGEVTLEVTVPPDADAGNYPLVLAASDGADRRELIITLVVQEQVDAGIGLTADFPSLRGDPGSAFSYTLTITNNTPEEETFTFAPQGPQGWTVTASPTAEAQAATVTIEAGGTSTVTVTATPPDTAAEGDYPIDVAVTAASGASGTISLTAQVTGTPELTLATADQRLDVSGGAGDQKRLSMMIANTGTAALEDVKFAATAPTGWEVSFEPDTIENVRPNETAQVTAVISPAEDAVAGDYAIAVRSSAGSDSSEMELRFSLEGSRTLGVIAIGVIVAVIALLAGVFLRFGRR